MNKTYSTIISFIISIFFLYLCFKDLNVIDLINQDININYFYLFISIFILYISIFIKSLRLKILLKNYKTLTFIQYTKPVLVRHFLNATLPGNLGEIAKPYILKNYINKPFFECLSITVIERFFDLIIITFIVGLALIFNDIGFSLNYVYFYFFLFTLGLIFFIFLAKSKYAKKILPLKIVKNIQDGFYFALNDDFQIIKLLCCTIFLWVILCIADFFLFSSFLVLDNVLSYQNIIFLTGVTVLAQLIPSAPSSIGVFNYLIIQTIEFYFNVNGIYIDNSIILEVTYASFIILIISILPDITWGFFVFVKETSIQLNKIKSYKFK